MAIWITRPSNDAVLYVGDLVVEFETRGFTSKEFPIEVRLESRPGKEGLDSFFFLFTRKVYTPRKNIGVQQFANIFRQ